MNTSGFLVVDRSFVLRGIRFLRLFPLWFWVGLSWFSVPLVVVPVVSCPVPLCDTPGFCVFWWFRGLVFGLVGRGFRRFVGVSCVFSGVCDTPVEFSVSNGLLGVGWGRVCVFVGCGVSFSLAAAQRVVPAGPVPRGG